jgi:hypothetical protein
LHGIFAHIDARVRTTIGRWVNPLAVQEVATSSLTSSLTRSPSCRNRVRMQ